MRIELGRWCILTESEKVRKEKRMNVFHDRERDKVEVKLCFSFRHFSPLM
jgi:hypothetical protein